MAENRKARINPRFSGYNIFYGQIDYLLCKYTQKHTKTHKNSINSMFLTKINLLDYQQVMCFFVIFLKKLTSVSNFDYICQRISKLVSNYKKNTK